MRITNSMMADQFLLNANESLNRLSKAQEQMDSTKRISSISDDPLATMSSLKARNKLSSLADYEDSVSTATSYLKENGNAVDSLNSVIQSAYELVVTANSGSKTSSDLSAIADEVAGLRDEVLSIANSSLGTTYLFGGNSSKTPFTIGTNGHLSYNGIDLTDYALKDDVTAQLEASGKAYGQISEVQANQSASTLELLGSSTDYTIKNTLCPAIDQALSTMISNGNTAIETAKKFSSEIDTSSLKSAIDDLTSLQKNLQSANSKDIVSTDSYDSQISTLTDELHSLQSGGASADQIAAKQAEITKVTEQKANALSNGFDASEIQSLLGWDGSATPPTTALTTAYNTYIGSLSTVQGAMDVGTGVSLGTESMASKQLQVGKTQTVQISENGLKLMGIDVSVTKDADGNITGASTNSSNASNLYYILDKCVNILNGNLDSGLLGEMTSVLQSAQSNVLSLDTEIGTSQNRMTTLSDRYTASKLTYKGMKSDAEDADMAAAAVELSTAKTVYDAALAAGAKIVQTSLINFLS